MWLSFSSSVTQLGVIDFRLSQLNKLVTNWAEFILIRLIAQQIDFPCKFVLWFGFGECGCSKGFNRQMFVFVSFWSGCGWNWMSYQHISLIIAYSLWPFSKRTKITTKKTKQNINTVEKQIPRLSLKLFYN